MLCVDLFVYDISEIARSNARPADDIKNPLAAIRTAARALADERAAGRSIDGRDETLAALVTQCDRITRVVDRYQRIGQAKPPLRESDELLGDDE